MVSPRSLHATVKRQLYYKLMFNMGWFVKSENTVNYGKLQYYEEWKYDDDWVKGINTLEAPVLYLTFFKFMVCSLPKTQN